MWWKLHDPMSVSFDSVPECDGRTDRQMDGHGAHTYVAHIHNKCATKTVRLHEG